MAASKKNSRTYSSPIRERQARDSRRRIMAAAEKLFRAQGFDQTTIDAIAKSAGVAAPTIYAAFKSKRGIFFALLDEARFGDAYKTLIAEVNGIANARDRLKVSARIARQIYQSELTTLDLFRGAAAVSPELAAMINERESSRRDKQRPLVKDLHDQGLLRPKLTVERAGDLMWTLTCREIFRHLVVECEWAPATYEKWLHECLVRELCGSE